MQLLLWLLAYIASWLGLSGLLLSHSSHLPAAIPLAVRSPYLSTWATGSKALNEQTVWFWRDAHTEWVGLVHVDGHTYSWLGESSCRRAKAGKVKITATSSTFDFHAGPIKLRATFISPVEPNDLLRQSLPFSYLHVEYYSTDGKAHNVSIYTDISSSWLSGDRSKEASSRLCNATTATTALCLELDHPDVYAEVEEQAEHGTVLYAIRQAGEATSLSSGHSAKKTRRLFAKHGVLDNEVSHKSRRIDKGHVHALAQNFGHSKEGEALLAIGHARDPAVLYRTEERTLQDRRLFYLSKFSSHSEALDFFLGDWERASKEARRLDQQIEADGAPYGEDYVKVLGYSVRQVYAATEITVSRTKDGFNTSDVLIFMKEISSNGDVNTIDVIYPAFPLYYYLSPHYIGLLLEPMLRFQSSGQWRQKYALHDMGTYPRATGRFESDEAMPLEEGGNMMHLVLAEAQVTGSTAQFDRYFKLFEQWAKLLEKDSLVPANQLSTDDFMGPLANQTNLALKGILGMVSYARLCQMSGRVKQAMHYRQVAGEYMPRFMDLALSKNKRHTKLAYQQDDSWSMLYNLFVDQLLDLRLAPKHLYELQTDLFDARTKRSNPYGIVLDTRRTWQLTCWLSFEAAALKDISPKAAQYLLDSISAYAHSGKNTAPFGDWLDVSTGHTIDFRARPVIGGHFAPLALDKARTHSMQQSVSNNHQNQHPFLI